MESSTSIGMLPIWARPPLRAVEKLPEIDRCREMDLHEYNQVIKNKKTLYIATPKDEILKKVVLSEIEAIPEIWNSKNTTNQNRYYQIVAVQTYKRTGKVLDIKGITTIFKFAKDAIRCRLRNCIRRGCTPEQTEEDLWTWPYYPFIRFYRKCMIPWEAFVRRQTNPSEDDQDDAMGEDDNMEYEQGVRSVEIVDQEGQPLQHDEGSNDSEAKPAVLADVKEEEDPDYGQYIYPPVPQPSYSNPHHVVYSNAYQQDAQYQMPSSTMMSASSSNGDHFNMANGVSSTMPYQPTPPPVASTSASDFEKEISQISFQAMRIARENPERVKLIRKVLFSTVLALDDLKYTDAGEVFRDLAERFS